MREPLLTAEEAAFVRARRVAHLATVDEANRPHVIPICFAFDGRCFYTPVDEKPKRVAPAALRRVRNIQANPRVAVVFDLYDEDWRRLGFVQVRGEADLLTGGEEHARVLVLLREKYPQYRTMVLEDRPIIRITPRGVTSWGVRGRGETA
ncbi:MAG: TIGR03668 family PPOX class F420-dependent oxidoreductase [Armatimonadetes bacterium]|nr:TIGR03668 family PPOX class F420-dependent oxidoreductase [Armatimonadota bacterium]